MEASSYTLRTNADGNWSPPWNRLSRRHESAANKRAGHRGTLSCRRACVCLLFTTILCLWNADRRAGAGVRAAPGRDDERRHYLHRQLPRPQQGGRRHDRPGTAGSIGTFITTDTSQRDNQLAVRHNRGLAPQQLLSNSQPSVGEPRHPRGADLGRFLHRFGNEDVPRNSWTSRSTSPHRPEQHTVTHDPTTAVTRSGFQQNYYVRTANVTALVSAAGNGTYTVGRVPATQGTDEVTSTPPAGRWPFSTRTSTCLPAASRCSSASSRREAQPPRSRASARRRTTESCGPAWL